VWQVPHVKGQIRRGTNPVVGATVAWITLEPFSEPTEAHLAGTGVTDQSGQFDIKEVRRFAVGLLLPAHSMTEWRMEEQNDSKTTLLWHQRLYSPGPRSTPGKVVVDCDIEAKEPCLLIEVDHPRLKGRAPRLPVE
jgi:hypothetical protein